MYQTTTSKRVQSINYPRDRGCRESLNAEIVTIKKSSTFCLGITGVRNSGRFELPCGFEASRGGSRWVFVTDVGAGRRLKFRELLRTGFSQRRKSIRGCAREGERRLRRFSRNFEIRAMRDPREVPPTAAVEFSRTKSFFVHRQWRKGFSGEVFANRARARSLPRIS